MWVRNFSRPNCLPDEVRAGVVRPDREDQQHDPTTFGAQDLKRGGAVDRGRRMAEPQDEPEHRDVDRPEHRRRPGVQAVPGLDLREGRHRDQDDADGDEERAAALEDLREGGVQDDDHGQGRPEGGDRLVAGRPKEPEDLDRGQSSDHGDEDGEHGARDREDDEQDRHEQGGTDRSLAHGPSGVVGQRPKRRCLSANSVMAASNASGPKSGHRVSHV